MTLDLTFQGHSSSNVIVSLDSTRNVFSCFSCFFISPKATMVNLKFSKEKSLKMRNAKFQKSQAKFCEHHWEKNTGQVLKPLAAICRGNSVLKLSLSLNSMLTKTKQKIVKTLIFKIPKTPNVVLIGTLGRKFRKGSGALKFSPHRVPC